MSCTTKTVKSIVITDFSQKFSDTIVPPLGTHKMRYKLMGYA